MKDKYMWGWDAEGQNWQSGKTVQDCLAQAIREVLVQYSPDEFIDHMKSHSLIACISRAEHFDKEGYWTDPISLYRLTMSGQWYKLQVKR